MKDAVLCFCLLTVNHLKRSGFWKNFCGLLRKYEGVVGEMFVRKELAWPRPILYRKELLDFGDVWAVLGYCEGAGSGQ